MPLVQLVQTFPRSDQRGGGRRGKKNPLPRGVNRWNAQRLAACRRQEQDEGHDKQLPGHLHASFHQLGLDNNPSGLFLPENVACEMATRGVFASEDVEEKQQPWGTRNENINYPCSLSRK
jgi:hypothetical protein